MSTTIATAWATSASPFKFLDHFAESEAPQFYGRRREIAEFTSLITAEKTAVLYGHSGVGKTSLLLAGVLPELRRRGFFPVHVRLLRDPLPDLVGAIARAAEEPSDGSLVEVLRRASAKKGPVVVILDQLEDLFVRFSREEDRAPVLAGITEVLASDIVRARFVFSIRQDYVAALDDLEGPLAELLDRRYRLKGLTSAGAREAIARPLYNAEIEFSQKLLNRLVDMLKVDGFDPPVLQIVCSELFRQAEQNHPARRELNVQDLDDTGGREAIFRRYLDRAVAAVPDEDHFILRGILSGFLTLQRTRKPTTIRQLGETERFSANACEIRQALHRLLRANVIRKEQSGNEYWFEVIHDRLVDVIEPWLAEDPRFFSFRFASRLVDQLSQNPVWRDDPGALIAAAQLDALIGPCKHRLRLQSDKERELLLRSAIHAQSDDISYWATQYEHEAAEQLILSLLSHPVARVRHTATLSVPKVFTRQNVIVGERCLALAIQDPDSTIQTEAGKAFAAIAPDEGILQLVPHLKNAGLQRSAYRTLAWWLDANRNVGQSLSDEQLQRGKRARDDIILSAAEKTLTDQQRIARRSGVFNGVIWFLTYGLSLSVIASWLAAPVHWQSNLYGILGVSFGFAIATGWILAPVALRSIATAHRLGGNMRWHRAVGQWRIRLAFLTSVFISEMFALRWMTDLALSTHILLALAFTLVSVVILDIVLRLAEYSHHSTTRSPSTLLVPGAATGLSLIVGACAMLTGPQSAVHAFCWASWVMATTTGGISFIVSRTIHQSDLLVCGSSNLRRSAFFLLVALTAFAAILLMSPAVGGRAPFLPSIVSVSTLESGQSVESPPGIPGAHWVELVNDRDELAVIEFTSETESTSVFVAKNSWRARGLPFTFIVPPGRHLFGIRSDSPFFSKSVLTTLYSPKWFNNRLELPSSTAPSKMRRELRIVHLARTDANQWHTEVIADAPDAEHIIDSIEVYCGAIRLGDSWTMLLAMEKAEKGDPRTRWKYSRGTSMTLAGYRTASVVELSDYERPARVLPRTEPDWAIPIRLNIEGKTNDSFIASGAKVMLVVSLWIATRHDAGLPPEHRGPPEFGD